jgi:hypothetical protein
METRCMMAELAAAKAQNTNLEEQIKKLHHVRLELDVVYDKEKTSLIKQQEQDRETVRVFIKRKCFSAHPDYLWAHMCSRSLFTGGAQIAGD